MGRVKITFKSTWELDNQFFKGRPKPCRLNNVLLFVSFHLPNRQLENMAVGDENIGVGFAAGLGLAAKAGPAAGLDVAAGVGLGARVDVDQPQRQEIAG